MINLEMFELIINKSQFDCIFSIINNVYAYRRYQYNYFETRKFQFFKPIGLEILPKKKEKDKDKDKSKGVVGGGQTNKNAITMWRYAINMTIKKIKSLRGE